MTDPGPPPFRLGDPLPGSEHDPNECDGTPDNEREDNQ